MARLPDPGAVTIDPFGRKPFLGLAYGGWASPGIASIRLTLCDDAPELIKWTPAETYVEIELSTEVAVQLFAQLTMMLAEFDELRRRNNWAPPTSDEKAELLIEPSLALKTKDDRIKVRMPLGASQQVATTLGPDGLDVRLSESAAQKLCEGLKGAAVHRRAERSMRALEEIP